MLLLPKPNLIAVAASAAADWPCGILYVTYVVSNLSWRDSLFRRRLHLNMVNSLGHTFLLTEPLTLNVQSLWHSSTKAVLPAH